MLLAFSAALAACTASPQETTMNSPTPDAANTRQGSAVARPDIQKSSATIPAGKGIRDQERAAVGPAPEPVSAAENPLPAGSTDLPAAAQGRRTLSTAFVQVGPDGLLTVKLRNARVLVLHNVVMRRKDYCGVQVSGGLAGAQFCGGYAEVASARPGGAPVTD